MQLKQFNKKLFWKQVRSIIYVLMHFSIFAAFWTGNTTASIVICVILFFTHMWAVTVGYHRYFSHKSFSTSRVFQFILAWLAQSSTQQGVLWWANHHRLHHLHSD